MLRRALFSLLLLLPGCPGPEVAVDAPVGMDAPRMDAAAGEDVPSAGDAALDTPSAGDAPMALDTPPTDAGACIPEGMTCAGATSPCCAPATCLLGFVCAIQPDAGPTPDAGRDAGSDAGRDAGSDAGRDAGTDAGTDAGRDAGSDAGRDAGRDAPTCGGLGASCGPMAPCCGGVCSGSPSGTCALCGVLRDRCSPTEPCCGDYTCSPGPTGFCI